MLTLENLSKSYGRVKVLANLNLSVLPGTLSVMEGPNGAGKSTLLRLLAQLEAPSAGTVRWAGNPMRPEAIGYLPQNVRFHPLLRVEAVARFYARVWGMSAESASAALVRWGLSDHRQYKTLELSGGLRQRLGLAVLSLNPKSMLLLDEPGLSLDPEWRVFLREWLVEVATAGTLVVVTTHLAAEWQTAASHWMKCAEGTLTMRPAACNVVGTAKCGGLS